MLMTDDDAARKTKVKGQIYFSLFVHNVKWIIDEPVQGTVRFVFVFDSFGL